MRHNKTQFVLKLSREKIQLLFKSDQDKYEEIGSTDPNHSEITKNLQLLQSQVYALTGKKPVIDVMLPDELILIQNLNIESANQPINRQEAIDRVATACALKRNEINVAVGSPTSHRTQPVAAVTTKTLDETRFFLNNAGFTTNRFIASKPINGFLEAPIFIQDKIPEKTYVNGKKELLGTAAIISSLVIAGALFILSPFETSESGDQLSDNISSIVAPKNLTLNSENKTKKVSVVPSVAPRVPINHNLQLSPLFHQNLLSKTHPPKVISRNTNSKPKTFPNLFAMVELITPDLTNKELQYSASTARFEKEYQADTLNNFGISSNHSSLPTQNSKLQVLKASIQYDYLRSIKIKVNQADDTIYINKSLELENPSIQITKHLNKTTTISKPRLSLLEKIKLKFVDKSDIDDLALDFTTTTATKSQITMFDETITKLEKPSSLLRQNKFIETLKNQNLERFSFELSPEENLLSQKYKPILRPVTIENIYVLAEPTLSSGAVTLSQTPILRPLPVASLTRINPSDITINAKATKKPSFPKRASIVNNATMSNIIELNRTNLIGVFGTEQNAIALIRLASGRVIKVKVGDKFDGWKVLGIYEDKIELANGKKQEILRLPG